MTKVLIFALHPQTEMHMKLPSKYIALLVILSLVGIFIYQAYWLTGLYHTMHNEMERSIAEAMRMSDYNEMMLRVERIKKDSTDHGEVSVSAGYKDDGNSFVHSSTTLSNKGTRKDSVLFIDSRKDKHKAEWLTPDSAQTELKEAVTDTNLSRESTLVANSGLEVLLRDQNSMLELATYFQRGLHSGLDLITRPDVALYDSLLTAMLQQRGIDLPHRLEYLNQGNTPDSSYVYIDTLAVFNTPGYVPGSKAVKYDYSFDLHNHWSYRLWMEPINSLVLRQMSGILTTSFIILIILSFSFWFLIRTILKQKTLEEIKSDFTNNITHELKTPIAVAYAANDALLNFNQAEEKAKRDKYLRICQEQLQRLSGLVEQILSMSMEHRKSFRLHPEVLSLHDILEPLIEQHKLKAEKPVHISVHIEPKDLTILADRNHFSNIISNLIDNAIKYSREEAEVSIHCRTTGTGQNRQTEIKVSDHGIGISTEKQKYIFDKFYRVPTGNLHNVKGYGLGLFYVKTMVEQHGGSISVKSEPGKGSVFIVLINS